LEFLGGFFHGEIFAICVHFGGSSGVTRIMARALLSRWQQSSLARLAGVNY
jgi:hypothetical protein